MAMVVQNNMNAINASNRLNINVLGTKKATEKLSSGFRINRAGDDAAGLAISEKMRAQMKGLGQAARNANDGISLIQTAEGALEETHSMLKRLKELAVQSANGTYSFEERFYMQNESEDILREINRIAAATDFNGIKLLDGSLGTIGGPVVADGTAGVAAAIDAATDHADGGIVFQVGAVNAVENSVLLNIGNMSAGAGGLGLLNSDVLAVESTTFDLTTPTVAPVVDADTAFDVTTIATAKTSLTLVDAAISRVSEQRAKLGSMQNRLEHTVNSLTVTNENIQAAESQIRDTDMAKEMVTYTKYSILQQAAQAMLAQANQAPQAILQLLR